MDKRFDDTDDKELLAHFYADGDSAWLGILLQRYTGMLLGVCFKYLKNEEDAKDSVQQIFEKVIGELPKYRVAYFKSWLYMIAKNHCLMRLRHKHREPVELSERMSIPSEEAVIDHRAKESEVVLLEKAIAALSEEQRDCVSQFYLDKKSYRDIAEGGRYSVLEVKSHIQNGKRNLKLFMQRTAGHD